MRLPKIIVRPLGKWASKSLTIKLLSQELNVPGSSIRIRRTKMGKPLLVSPNGHSFNISHSHGLFVLALCADDLQVGVDIEQLRSTRFLKIAERFFCESEIQSIRRQKTRAAQLRRFFELWTIKESVLKCLGWGVFRDISKIRIRGKRGIAIETSPQLDIQVRALTGLPRGYIGHLALQRLPHRVRRGRGSQNK